MAELAWPAARIAVVTAPRPVGEERDYEAEDRDRAFAGAGWWVTTAADCTAADIADRLAAAHDNGTYRTHGERQ